MVNFRGGVRFLRACATPSRRDRRQHRNACREPSAWACRERRGSTWRSERTVRSDRGIRRGVFAVERYARRDEGAGGCSSRSCRHDAGDGVEHDAQVGEGRMGNGACTCSRGGGRSLESADGAVHPRGNRRRRVVERHRRMEGEAGSRTRSSSISSELRR